jgi:hypothetical protein
MRSRGVHPGSKLSGFRALILILILMPSLLGSCDPVPPLDRIGLTSEADHLQLRYVLCPEEIVTRIRLFEIHGDSVPDEDDVVIWEIRANEPERLEVFVVGDTPSGYEEIVPIAHDPRPNMLYSFTVDSTRQRVAALGFKTDQLEDGRVLTSYGDSLTMNEFVDSAKETCS